MRDDEANGGEDGGEASLTAAERRSTSNLQLRFAMARGGEKHNGLRGWDKGTIAEPGSLL